MKISTLYTKTCAVNDLQDWAVTFVRSGRYLEYLADTDKNLKVFVPDVLTIPEHYNRINIEFIKCSHPDYEFTLFHNSINQNRHPLPDVYGSKVSIHPSAVIGEGIRVANAPDGSKVQLKHMGNVVFGNDVYVGPLTLIERACLSSTYINHGVKIDGRCTIGHNSTIGNNTVVASGAVIGGSAYIGTNCWIGLNATIKNGVSICNNVVVGMGTVITKDIAVPGIYAGVPGVFKKAITANNWNF